MLSSHVPLDVLDAAARAIGAELRYVRSHGGTRYGFRVLPVRPEPYLCNKVHTLGGRPCWRVLDRMCEQPHYTHRKRCPKCGAETEPRDFPYWRTSVGWGRAGRRIYALCWHGFRDFFREVYLRAPDARFRTGMATYRSREHFEEVYLATGYRNIGPQIAPVQAREACFCSDYGRDYDAGFAWYAANGFDEPGRERELSARANAPTRLSKRAQARMRRAALAELRAYPARVVRS